MVCSPSGRHGLASESLACHREVERTLRLSATLARWIRAPLVRRIPDYSSPCPIPRASLLRHSRARRDNHPSRQPLERPKQWGSDTPVVGRQWVDSGLRNGRTGSRYMSQRLGIATTDWRLANSIRCTPACQPGPCRFQRSSQSWVPCD